MAHLDERAVACGYANYSETYVTYPPKGLLPVPGGTIFYPDECDVWYQVFNAALLVNPAFNMYRIFDTVRDFPLYSLHQSENGPNHIIRSTRSFGMYLVSR